MRMAAPLCECVDEYPNMACDKRLPDTDHSGTVVLQLLIKIISAVYDDSISLKQQNSQGKSMKQK